MRCGGGSAGRGRRRGAAVFRDRLSCRFWPAITATPDGLFTGYFEITLHGSRQRARPVSDAALPPPAGAGARYTRAEIEDGALAGQGLELLWVDDPIDAFFLEIQGSGRVRLRDGGIVRVGYDGQNGKPYVAVGRLLIERGEIPREKVTMAAIRGWMKAHPKEGAALRRENPSYVFFREIPGDGPARRAARGADRRSAASPSIAPLSPLGVPIWLDAQRALRAGRCIRRLVVAQDTGGAIKGPVRGDLFWGHGEAAAARRRRDERARPLLPAAAARRWRHAARAIRRLAMALI